MRPVNAVDQLFFRLERRHQPMHVGGLQLFRLPHDAPPDFARHLLAELRACGDVRPPFDTCVAYRLCQPFWVRAHTVDLDHHVRHMTLPRPGGMAQLLASVSQLHATPLPRAQPLWQCYLIEGVGDHQLALYYKMHHALMDGVSAMRLCRDALATDPADTRPAAIWTRACAGHTRDSAPRRLSQPLRLAMREATSLPGVVRALRDNRRDQRHDSAYTGLGQAPRCILNQRISSARRIVAQAYPLARIKRVGQRHDATVNDIILAMCGGALRHYLRDLDALPRAPLITIVPVSLHDHRDGHGNRVAMICASLGTHLAAPRARLAVIQRSVDYWKRRHAHMTPQQTRNLTAAMAMPAGINLLTGLAPQRPAFNLIISNVPGPERPLYLRGAELQHIYPASVVLDGMALNITVTSYCGQLHFGLTACRRTLPNIDRMLGYLQAELDALDSTN